MIIPTIALRIAPATPPPNVTGCFPNLVVEIWPIRDQSAGGGKVAKGVDRRQFDGLATQLMILGEGAVAQALVHSDPKMARAAREAARVLLLAAGVQVLPSSHRRTH